MFDSLVRPILTYGSEVWGASKSGLQELDRVFLQYMRCVWRIKATTSNLAVYGECGRPTPLPPPPPPPPPPPVKKSMMNFILWWNANPIQIFVKRL